jgi:hypothetical protein
LAPDARAALIKLVDAYFEAGFENPGIVVLSDSELAALSNPPAIANYLDSSYSESDPENHNQQKRRGKR